MTGKTHMSIGALGASLAVPIVLNHVSAHAMISSVSQHGISSFEQLIVGICAGAIGGIIPDLDQKDGMMTRRVERFGKIALFIGLIVVLVMLHLWQSPIALFVAAFVFLAFVHHAEWVRKFSLILLCIGAIYIEFTNEAYMGIALFAAIWFGITAFSKHRTFTHSLVGILVSGAALYQLGRQLHVTWITDAATIGYVLHVGADFIAGGVPIFWPVRKRLGVRAVKTNGLTDRMIGLAGVACMFLLVFA